MAQDQTNSDAELGVFARKRRRGPSPSEIVAAALSGLWLAACVVFFLVMDTDLSTQTVSGFVMILLAVFLPVAIIWLAASAARSAQVMREETARLQSTIDSLRNSYLTQSQVAQTVDPNPELLAKIEELTQAQEETEKTVATFSSRREAVREEPVKPKAPEPLEMQTMLELGAEDEKPPLTRIEMIRALHFPETADDQEGFAALKRALEDHKVARLIQAAQDVLTLLSQDGIYMDDLRPDRARPEVWRRFAEGHRGREVAALGGIRDRSSLALTAGRMKSDPIFRDAAHHFLRRFDDVFLDFEKIATDEEIARLSETRSARAFMLLGRVTGTFT